MEFKGKYGKNQYYLRPIGSMNKNDWAVKYAQWVNDDAVTKFLYQGTIPASIEKCRSLYDILTNENNVVFNIFKNANPGDVHIGIVGIFGIYWPSRVGEFRILLGNKSCWGDGVGKKTLELMNIIAFDRLNLHKFWLGYNASHKRAEGAYAKAGFQHECVIKSHHYKNGVYNDLVRLCMFREDYDKWLSTKLDSSDAVESDTNST